MREPGRFICGKQPRTRIQVKGRLPTGNLQKPFGWPPSSPFVHLDEVRPHPPLKARYETLADKPDYVNRLFDKGACHYDGIVDWGFFRTGGAYRKWVQERHGLKKGDRVLDVACGTGLVALAASRILGTAENITCLDPSEGMLAVARTKLNATFVVGRAEALPFPDNSFDFLTMGYALRHVTDLEETFREYQRVLKPGGKLLILEVTKPRRRIPQFLFRTYFGRIYPTLTQLFTRSADARDMMRYYWETMDACVPPEAVLSALATVGLSEVNRYTQLGLFSEYTATKPSPSKGCDPSPRHA